MVTAPCEGQGPPMSTAVRDLSKCLYDTCRSLGRGNFDVETEFAGRFDSVRLKRLTHYGLSP